VISKGELESALKKLGKKPKKSKVDAVFTTLDVNGDGRIDFDEFAKYFREEDTEEESSSNGSKKARN